MQVHHPHYLDVIKQERPDLYKRIMNKEISIRRANAEMALNKEGQQKPITLTLKGIAKDLKRHFSEEEREHIAEQITHEL